MYSTKKKGPTPDYKEEDHDWLEQDKRLSPEERDARRRQKKVLEKMASSISDPALDEDISSMKADELIQLKAAASQLQENIRELEKRMQSPPPEKE
eukprot:NODE_5585_length_565_cov_76.087209_g4853_i0.p2 GENE.NODE_5585_length_565_cov_76.087209_g4853_i0~~NODE_5585_length_565_cov_76.087209_g4853_i0.p2  ORF type:complete len:96 (-),score=34.85 NODE_5585_length_565_cov_76.087209_g4853_i0:105-392(-)